MHITAKRQTDALIQTLLRLPQELWDECCDRFFQQTLLHGKRGELTNIQNTIAQWQQHGQDAVSVTVHTARPLDNSLLTPLLRHFLGTKKIQHTMITDARLIGGVELETSDTMLRNSLNAQLEHLRTFLHNM